MDLDANGEDHFWGRYWWYDRGHSNWIGPRDVNLQCIIRNSPIYNNNDLDANFQLEHRAPVFKYQLTVLVMCHQRPWGHLVSGYALWSQSWLLISLMTSHPTFVPLSALSSETADWGSDLRVSDGSTQTIHEKVHSRGHASAVYVATAADVKIHSSMRRIPNLIPSGSGSHGSNGITLP